MNLAKISVVEILSKPYMSDKDGCWIVDCVVDCWGNITNYKRAFAYEHKANAFKIGDSWGE